MKKVLILIFILFIGVAVLFLNLKFRKKIGYAVHGIDISYYQEKVNFKKVVNDGFDFVFIKATEGGSLKDRKFNENWERAGEEEILKSAYHFFRADIDPYRQADWFVKHVNLKEGDLPPVLDVETFDNMPIPIIRERVSIWLNLIEKKYNIRPIIYTNYSYYHDVFYKRKVFDKYPIWIAAYNKVSKPVLKDNSKNWVIWQYSDNGSARGIDGNVDLNVFYGTIEDLRRMCIPGKFKEEEIRIHIPKTLPKVGR